MNTEIIKEIAAKKAKEIAAEVDKHGGGTIEAAFVGFWVQNILTGYHNELTSLKHREVMDFRQKTSR